MTMLPSSAVGLVRLPDSVAAGDGRDAGMFGTIGVGAEVPKPGQGYSGADNIYQGYSILTPLQINPYNANLINQYVAPTPYWICSVGVNTWMAIGFAPAAVIPSSGSPPVGLPGGWPWWNVITWQLIHRNPTTGALTLGPANTVNDPTIQVQYADSGYSGAYATPQTNIVGPDGSFSYVGYGHTAYVRSCTWDASYTTPHFADFVLPAAYQVPFPADNTGYPAGFWGTGPNQWMGWCQPIALNKNVGVIALGRTYGAPPTYTTISNGAVFSYNPSTGVLIDTINYPQPTENPIAALIGNDGTHDVLWVTGPDNIAHPDTSVAWILPMNSNGTFGTPISSVPGGGNTNDVGQRWVGTRYVSGPGWYGYLGYVQLYNVLYSILRFVQNGVWQTNGIWAPMGYGGGGGTGNVNIINGYNNVGAWGGSYCPGYQQGAIWQQSVFGNPWDTSGVTTYTKYDFNAGYDWAAAAANDISTTSTNYPPITATYTVPSATATPDGAHPASFPRPGSPYGQTIPYLGILGVSDPAGNMLWYYDFPRDDYNDIAVPSWTGLF